MEDKIWLNGGLQAWNVKGSCHISVKNQKRRIRFEWWISENQLLKIKYDSYIVACKRINFR